MKTSVWLAVCLLAASVASTALADPPNDCGVNICYPGQNCTSTYCGEYTPVGGGLLLCACSNGRECVDSTNDVNEVGPDGLQVPGLCTTPGGFACNNSNELCEGHSTCVNGQCCVRNACPANTCGDVPDGCGGYQACSTASNCTPIMLTITPEFPGQPVHQFDWTGVSLSHGAGAKQFNLVFTDPYGNVTYQVESPGTDDNGNWSGYVGGTYEPYFDTTGMWQVYATFQHSRPTGWYQSNTVWVQVVQ